MKNTKKTTGSILSKILSSFCKKDRDILANYGYGIYKNKKIYTSYQRGSGKWTQRIDRADSIISTLNSLGIKYITGNTAPRGGVVGNYIELNQDDKLFEIIEKFKLIQERNERIKRAIVNKKKAEEKRFLDDITSKLTPNIMKFADLMIESYKLKGYEKSQKQAECTRAIISESGIELEKCKDIFWKIKSYISDYIHSNKAIAI